MLDDEAKGDAIEASRQPRIIFDDDVDVKPSHNARPPRARRASDATSISSVRSRAQATSGLPVAFRTLSFEVARLQDSDRKLDAATNPEYFEDVNHHILAPSRVCETFGVQPDQGLSEDDAKARVQRYGRNVLPKKKKRYWKKLLFYVFGNFCSILWVGVVIFFICWRPLGNPPQPYNLGLAILVMIVIFLQAAFSAFQDWSTKKTMDSILDLLPSQCAVVRGGQTAIIRSADLVPGDIVNLSIGNKVPADLRLLSTSGDVRFDRAVLTGEADEIDGAVNPTDDNFLETRNIALMGTVVTNGKAQGIVVGTGPHTVMGSVAQATTDVKEKPTLIQREITRFIKIILCLTFCLALLILLAWVGWLRVDKPNYMNLVACLNNVMGCVVAFIPEGMPVGVALTLMMVARRMKSAYILPKGLSTVESLGCVNVICSDKTGTLTRNQMSVASVSFHDRSLAADEALAVESNGLTALVEAGQLCNEAAFDPVTLHLPVAERHVQGNATDGAILRFVSSHSASAVTQRKVLFQIPFNSTNKWMMTMSAAKPGENGNLVIVKGAPDILLHKCSSFLTGDGERMQLDIAAQRHFGFLQEQMSGRAERVLMLCERRYTPVAAVGSNALGDELVANCLSDLTLIGIIGLVDPPREDCATTIATCRRAGIRFFMVTGDFGRTAVAIARRVGIFSDQREPDTYATISAQTSSAVAGEKTARLTEYSKQSLLLESTEINRITPEEWEVVNSYEEIVFARTTPNQKLLIVNALRERQNTVAVTGDGVNDAPALRAADVGVAIASGSDVALEAADLVLLDDFSAIVTAIRLGRLVFQNLQKVISYLLPAGSWSEIWPVLLNVFVGVPLPLSSFLMIIICVFTDLFLSLSLIMEKEEFDLLSIPPRKPRRDHLINLKIYAQSYLFIGVMETVIAHAMFFLYMYRHAGIPASALFLAFEKYADGFYGYTADELTYFNTVGQCVYFVTLVILQWGNILSIRNKRLSILQADPFFRKERRNLWLLGGIAASLVIAIFVTEEPGIQSIFGTASVPIEFWLLPLPLALGILIMDEFRKLLVRQWPNGPVARIAW
ncbi:Sodium/potassium-transporting ATPase subunit alpha [Cyphellophora attinorum]|uniref:Sodium/potassium-transporting ATPase subunit alpha n=1 Tax=Cyphellophora attinorum TaxID=1664694 RepID=A0A0N1NYJ2_9EURO|nr:Sodium/potassium-transporting ATPase subunit alpha [Phialophora attinorum]KPI36825.1 Sodium/potassium-transporting ATPase subunit alpha [Phialophora attinorum]